MMTPCSVARAVHRMGCGSPPDRPVFAARLHEMGPKVVSVFVVHFERVNLHVRGSGLIDSAWWCPWS